MARDELRELWRTTTSALAMSVRSTAMLLGALFTVSRSIAFRLFVLTLWVWARKARPPARVLSNLRRLRRSWPPTPRLGLSTPATRRLVPAPTAFSQIGLGCLVAALCIRRRTPLSPALLASWRQVGLYYVVFICS